MEEEQYIPYQCSIISASRVLVLAPHPDDETFGIGGTLIQHSERGEQVKVVFLTNGAKGTTQERNKNSYVALRRQEAISACAVLGISDLEFWLFEDRALDGSSTALSKTIELLTRFQPELVYVPSPLEIHPDHRATAFYFEKSIKKYEFDFKIAFYEISQPILGINTLVDITPVLERKKEAMAAYQSQIQERPYDEICVSLNRFRGLTLPSSVTHAEGFFVCDAKSVKNGFLLKNLFQNFSEFYHFPNMNNILSNSLVQRTDSDLNQSDNKTQQDSPLFSVIVPTYNRPEMLKKAIQSILDQTFQDFEIIVVNDAGNDVTEIIQSFDEGSRLICLAHEQNRGVASARNTGLLNTRGKFIAYLDDDDFYYPDHLKYLAEVLNTEKYKVAYTNSHEVFQTWITDRYVITDKKIAFNSDFDKRELLVGNYIPTLSIAHDRAIVEETGFFDKSLEVHEDWDMWIRFSLKYEFYHINQVTAAYTTRMNRTSKRIKDRQAFLESAKQIHFRYAHLISDPKLLDKQRNAERLLQKKVEEERSAALLADYLRLHRYHFALPFVKEKKVLVIECEEGDGCLLLAETASSVLGISSDVSVVRHASSNYFNENLSFREMGGFLSGIREESYDVIVAFTDSIWAIGFEQLFSFVKQTLGEDGVFLLSFPDNHECAEYSELSINRIRIESILKEKFCTVCRVGQAFFPASNIFPLNTLPNSSQEILSENYIEDELVPIHYGRKTPEVFLFIASNQKEMQTEIANSYYIDIANKWLNNQNKYLSRLKVDLNYNRIDTENALRQKNDHIENLEKCLQVQAEAIRDKDTYIREALPAKDRHIENLTREIQALNGSISDKNNHIKNQEGIINNQEGIITNHQNLKSIVQDKDNHIDNILKIIEEKEKTVENLRHSICKIKKDHKEELNAQDQLVKNQNQQIFDKDIHIFNRENELDLIKNSVVWRSAEFLRNLIYNKVLGVFPVLRKAVLTFRFEGRKAFLKKTKVYLQNKRLFPISDEEKNEYEKWIDENILTRNKIIDMRGNIEEFHYKPKISLIMPVYNVDPKWLKKAIQSVLNQIYSNWELCIADDASTRKQLRKILEKYSSKDKRIKIKFLPKNQGISGASNEALSLATGEFIGLLDNDDELSVDALYKCVRLLNKHSEADLIYSDEDKLEMDGRRTDPYFKPDFSLDLLLSMNYICHFCLIRTSIIKEIKGFRLGYEGSQDHDLLLRVIEKTIPERIFHIPEILYHWRKIPGSAAMVVDAKQYAFVAAKKAIKDYLKRNGIEGDVFDGLFTGSYRVRRKIIDCAKVSIVIPFKDQAGLLKNCVTSIWEKTLYPNYELVLVNNRSQEKETIELLNELKTHENVKLLEYDKPFNFSAINNYAVNQIDGEYVLLLNNDVEIISREWLSSMVEHIQREEVGCVGAKLLFPNNIIQHAGVIMGIGVASHAFSGLPADFNGYAGFINTIRNYCAVTGACLLTRKKTYEELGGLDEEGFSVAYNDVDYCLKALHAGYKIVYTPYAVLYHHESASRGNDNDPNIDINDPDQFYRIMAEREYMVEKWEKYIQNDPYYNPNLTRGRNDFSIRLD